jgi:hypothetical protein
MRLRPSRVIAATFLILAAAVCALWVRSYRTVDALHLRRGVETYEANSRDGSIMMWSLAVFSDVPTENESTDQSLAYEQRGAGGEDNWHPFLERDLRWGFGRARVRTVSEVGVRIDAIAFPLWMPILFLASPTVVVAVAGLRRRRRRARGCCERCGYDLRATPAECPECGSRTVSRQPHNPPMQRTATAGTESVG